MRIPLYPLLGICDSDSIEICLNEIRIAMTKTIMLTELTPEDLLVMIEDTIRKVLFEKGISPLDNKSSGLLDEKSIIKILGVSKATLYLWRRDRKIPFQRVGKKIFYSLRDVEMVMGIKPEGNIRHGKRLRRKERNEKQL